MLVLTRRDQEVICIGPDIEIMLIRGENGRAKIGIVAPDDVLILRKELKRPTPGGSAATEDRSVPIDCAGEHRFGLFKVRCYCGQESRSALVRPIGSASPFLPPSPDTMER